MSWKSSFSTSQADERGHRRLNDIFSITAECAGQLVGHSRMIYNRKSEDRFDRKNPESAVFLLSRPIAGNA
jgi:hypothetical protein